MNLIRLLALAVLLVHPRGSLAAAPPPQQEYIFAVVPQTSAVKLAQAWVPFLDQVSKASGVKLKFLTARTIDAFEETQLLKGTADFAWANPLSYVKAHQKQGYLAFAREARTRLKGILVARADSSVQSLADLRGKRVILPAPSAFAAHIINKGDLVRAGLIPGKDVEVRAVSSHDSAYLAVLSGQAEAAGGVERTFQKALSDAQRAKLKIIHTTAAVLPHPFAVHPRVPRDVQDRVKEALIKVSNDPRNAGLLESLGMRNGFETAADADYSDARDYQEVLASDGH